MISLLELPIRNAPPVCVVALATAVGKDLAPLFTTNLIPPEPLVELTNKLVPSSYKLLLPNTVVEALNLGTYPAVPDPPIPDAGVVQEAKPFASEVNILPAPGDPPVNLKPADSIVPAAVIFPLPANIILVVVPALPLPLFILIPFVKRIVPYPSLLSTISPSPVNITPAPFEPEKLSWILSFSVTAPKNLLLPPIDCGPLVNTPPIVASAGVKFNTPEVIVAPLALDVPEIAPTEETAFNVDQLAFPEASDVSTFPKAGVPPVNFKEGVAILAKLLVPVLS